MSDQSALRPGNSQALAVLLMALSVLLYGAFPVVGVVFAGQIDPFGFVIVAHTASWLTAVTVVAASRRVTISSTFRNLRRRDIAALSVVDGLLNTASHGALFIGIVFAPAVATVSYETWPVFVVLGLGLMGMFRGHRMSVLDFIFSAMAFVGLVVLTLEGQDLATLIEIATSADSVFWGLIASLCMALAAIAGIERARRLSSTKGILIASWQSQALAKTFSGPVVLVAVLVLDPARVTDAGVEAIGYAILTGFGIIAFGAAFYNAANLYAKSPTINLFYYLTPIVSLVLLWSGSFDEITVKILLGAAIIIIANLLAVTREQVPHSFTMTMVALTVLVAYVYSVEGIAMNQLYAVLGAPMAIFAILIAFLGARSGRWRNEQTKASHALVTELARRATLPRDLSYRLAELLAQSWSGRRQSAIHHALERVESHIDDVPLRILVERALIARLSPFSFGELLVLWLLAALIVLFLVVYRTTGFAMDLTAIVLSTAVIFLSASIFDPVSPTLRRLYRQRLRHILSEKMDSEHKTELDPLFPALLFALAFGLIALLFAEKHNMLGLLLG